MEKRKSRRGINLEALTIIPESDIPRRATQSTPYAEMLRRIRKGHALVVSDEELSIDTVRAGVRRLQDAGKFKKFIVRTVKGADGIRRAYIINPSEPEEEPES